MGDTLMKIGQLFTIGLAGITFMFLYTDKQAANYVDYFGSTAASNKNKRQDKIDNTNKLYAYYTVSFKPDGKNLKILPYTDSIEMDTPFVAKNQLITRDDTIAQKKDDSTWGDYIKRSQKYFRYLGGYLRDTGHVAKLELKNFDYRYTQFRKIVSDSIFNAALPPLPVIKFHYAKFRDTLLLHNNVRNNIYFCHCNAGLLDIDSLSAPARIKVTFDDCEITDFHIHKIDTARIKLYLANVTSKSLKLDPKVLSHCKLGFDPDHFPLAIFSDDQDIYTHKELYLKLKKNYEDTYEPELAKAADIAYNDRYENAFFRFFSGFFTNYGNKKARIIYITFFSLLVIFVINNIINYTYLQDDVYKIKAIAELDQKEKQYKKYLYRSFLYSAFIFFSLGINKDDIQFKRRIVLVIWFFIFYSWGVLCLGYLTGFVLGK